MTSSVRRGLVVLAWVAAVGMMMPAGAAWASTGTTWPGYLNGPRHSSYAAAETAITPSTAPDLAQKWHFLGSKGTLSGQPAPGYLTSPTVADGAVFIGSDTGWFYQLDERTGAVLHKVFLGFQPALTCPTAYGIIDTATVAVDPADGQPTVYVGAPDGHLYAFTASNLALQWKSVIGIPSAKTNDYFQWSSPTVANGKIYIGVSSNCDHPLVRGGVLGFDQATGAKFAEFDAVPANSVGGSVWSSVAVGPGGDVYASTGNGPNGAPALGYSESIIQLAPQTLKPLAYFQVPAAQRTRDGDFGGSPTIFGPYVGACDKNGYFYALLRSTMTLAWQMRIATQTSAGMPSCTAAAAYDGEHLVVAGAATTIGGVAYRGSIQEWSTAGFPIWQTGLPEGVLGTASADGGGVVAVGTFDSGTAPNATYLVDAASGSIVRTLISGPLDFGQSVFAGGWLFTANSAGVSAWGP